MKKIKSKFNILKIGKFRFYSGLLIGIIYSYLINLLLNLLVKSKDITYALSDGNWSKFLNSEVNFYYSFLISLLSANIAFCFTTYIWMSKIYIKNKREKLKIRYSQTNAIFTFGLIFLILIRFYQIYFQFNFSGFSLNLKDEYGVCLYFLPAFIFMNNWNNISRIYRARKSFFISFIIILVYGLILSQ